MQAQSLDEAINQWIGPVSDAISSVIFYSVTWNAVKVPLIVLWLIAAGLFFFLYLKAINIRRLGLSIDIVRGKYDDPDSKGEVSHFQALATAVSGTVGLGNIAGVAVAVSLGGPGATFWMIVAGFLGMMTKMVECTLGVKYRAHHRDGSVSGGPMYYLYRGFKLRGWEPVGKWMAILFAIMCIGGSFGGGNMYQSNQATAQLIVITGGAESFLAGNLWVAGLLLSMLVGVVIIGGIRSIAAITEKIVPFMCGLYILSCLFILVKLWYKIPETFGVILEQAFAADAVYGGVIGALIIGFKRASFSNEAGVGSASIAHAAVKTDEPVTEGLVAMLEPLIDTIIICTMTALVIVITGAYQLKGMDGIAMTSAAFQTVIHWYPYVLSLTVFLFAFSTMISWSYYGLKSWTFVFGPSLWSEYSYKFIFCLMVVIGSSLNMMKVIEFSDAMIFAMSLFNVIGMYSMAREVKSDVFSFLNKIDSGEIKKTS
ncbi:MAG: alanine:cation symporter family protein [Cytophagaceae bacterium]|jgi:AGCS family alanine or glycine:cation symporter|nr:alanine:cation symporter family protein [Cytophagaceae bacterium]